MVKLKLIFIAVLTIIPNVSTKQSKTGNSGTGPQPPVKDCAWTAWGQWSRCYCYTKTRNRIRQLAVIPTGCKISGCAEQIRICPSCDQTTQPTIPLETTTGPQPTGTTTKSDDQWRQDFDNYCQRFGRNYNATEKERRLRIYKDNMQKAHQCNQDDEHATYGETPFTDKTQQEFKYMTGTIIVPPDIAAQGQNPPQGTVTQASTQGQDPRGAGQTTAHATTHTTTHAGSIQIPTTVNWTATTKGVVYVKNQGSCGSCYAFCSICDIDYKYAIFKNSTPSSDYSVQSAMDCDTTDGGCNGGWPENVYKGILNVGGIPTSQTNPYTGASGTCGLPNGTTQPGQLGNPSYQRYCITPYCTSPYVINATQMQSMVAQSPAAILINAGQTNFQTYTGGIMSGSISSCNNTWAALDHCVTVVGYGVSNGVNYWLCQNSWGPGWGEYGFFRIKRGINACGCEQYITSSYLPQTTG